MKIRAKQFGLSLVETIVVVAVVALMIGLAIPAVKTFMNPMTSSAGVESMISAALSSARAIAAKNQKYAGIRFQQDKNGNQYMIAIIYDYDPNGTVPNHYVNSFTVVKGISPVKLPENVGVMNVKTSTGSVIGDGDINTDAGIKVQENFSIIFSPSGQLVIHDARLSSVSANDTVVNTLALGLFDPDGTDYKSVSSFKIYDIKQMKSVAFSSRWTDYLADVEEIFINPYSGSIISNK